MKKRKKGRRWEDLVGISDRLSAKSVRGGLETIESLENLREYP